MIDLKKQVADSVQQYATAVMAAARDPDSKISPVMQAAMELTVKQAMLSGMSLTAHYFAANEGHAEITPQAFEKAVLEHGRELDLSVEQLSMSFLRRMEEERQQRKAQAEKDDKK